MKVTGIRFTDVFTDLRSRDDTNNKINKQISLLRFLPGQLRVLHERSSRDAPTQVLPPLLGVSFVQLRVRCCRPDPQLLLHVFHELQVDQPPSTKTERKKMIRNTQAKE